MINTTKKIPLFVIGSKNEIVKTIENVMAGDFQLYDVKGIHLIDDKESTGNSHVTV